MSDEYCRKCKSKLATCPTCKGKGTTKQGGTFSGYSDKPCPNRSQSAILTQNSRGVVSKICRQNAGFVVLHISA